MEIRNEAERTATYFVQVPIKFCFKALNGLDRDEVIKLAYAEIDKRLGNAQVSVDIKDIEIIKKWTDFILEERLERERKWKEFLKNL